MTLEERARGLIMSVLLGGNLGYDDLLAALVEAQEKMRERCLRITDGYAAHEASREIRALEIPGDKEAPDDTA